MEKSEIIAFFDRCPPTWDAEQIDRSAAIETILDNAQIAAGLDVLDVACGTGILFPHYLSRCVKSITGIDISPEMAGRAAEKFADEPGILVLCGDVETAEFDRQFDRVMVYNAFPHFPDPARLIARLAALLKDGGRLTIAHGMSREQINAHHAGAAQHVSCDLLAAEELQALFAPYFHVDVVISDDEMYEVSGIKK